MGQRVSVDKIMQSINEIEYIIDWQSIRQAFGEHISKKIGAGFRFAGVRPEAFWPMGRPNERVSEVFDETYVTVWQTTRKISVYLLDDLSSSMDFGTHPSKSERAARIAAAIAYSALKIHDEFTYIGFSDCLEPEMYFVKSDFGKDLPWQVARSRLNFFSTRKSATAFGEALEELPKYEPCLCFIVSDFLPHNSFIPYIVPQLEKHDIVPIVLRDFLEDEIPEEGGYVSLKDNESGKEILVSLGIKKILEQENSKLKQAFNFFGIEAVWCMPQKDDLSEIMSFFLRRLKD